MRTPNEPVLFNAEFESANGSEQRRSTRAPVALEADIGRGGLDRTLCKVTDLSMHGARLQIYSQLRKGSMIWLTLPIVGPIVAIVRWSDDFEAGCKFEQRIAPRLFKRLVKDQPPQIWRTGWDSNPR
ncbi:PilZ domain-containing protein [Sphingomonas floccifaciens]|uniref:PilZ domain-containing protein n=1 Tax=Sphingomonas floccifaciens TaxID=1844115 RepID=A0ABW4NEW6_9SPHN